MSALDEYYKIINFRKNNPLPKGTYTEKHHVKPKSIYPELENDPNNIVKLTAEEHYKCHALLPDIYTELHNEIGYRKMLFAWNMIASTRKDLSIDEQSVEYARLREEFSKAVSEAKSGENAPWYGKHLSEETRKKMSKVRLGKPKSEETKRKISEANLGKLKSEETREKMSKARLGKPKSEDHKQKISKAMLGENHPRYGKRGKDSPNYGKKYKHSEEYYLKHPEKRPSAGII